MNTVNMNVRCERVRTTREYRQGWRDGHRGRVPQHRTIREYMRGYRDGRRRRDEIAGKD